MAVQESVVSFDPGIDLAVETMISQQLVGRGIDDSRVIAAFRRIPRRMFVPDYLEHKTYLDDYLPIGLGQTISPPYVTARMIQEMRLPDNARVLEVGTGSGYQTALLSTIAREVHTIEIRPELAARARRLLLDGMGIGNIEVHVGDGFQGWSEGAPYDAIVVNAAVAEEAPWPLVGQLRDGARLVVPVGLRTQRLHVVVRDGYDEDVTVLDEAAYAGKLLPLEGEAEEEG
ncbi:MAG: protein-L-isoaspartate(D-aspartate) O-methyltransferase [Myxococcales bacterium]|nr:protein-L-isoaspartate(D-aspartate) O-methyltransferase [Myxococcales bacterium]MCB9736630.1 protein-L-isoaspartate(D-aspartate) O-methyltransferase [Deltaproteobacteria bacterium]